MTPKFALDHLGEPDLKVAGFQVWIHGREHPDANDYYDGNWLRLTAHCGASGASVRVEGGLLAVTDIAGFGDQCAALLEGNSKTSVLEPLEPHLKLNLSLTASDHAGHISAEVEITPDFLTQAHRFKFEIDQSYLPEIIRQCSAIVREYPIRGLEEGKGDKP